MRRRDFIAALGGAAASWPLVARAQERMRRVGILMNATAEEPEAQSYVAAFQQGIQEFGWSVGRNLRLDLRWGSDGADRARRYAAELAALSPDVMLAAGGPDEFHSSSEKALSAERALPPDAACSDGGRALIGL